MGTGTKDISHRIARGPDCRAVGTVQIGLRLWFANILHELEFHSRNASLLTGDYLVGSEDPRAARWFLLLLAFRASDGQPFHNPIK
jgi:hypothetical protein